MTRTPDSWRGRTALAVMMAAALASSPMLLSADPARADEDPLLRVWTGAKNSAVGTGLASTSCDFTGDGHDDLLTSDWLWKRGAFHEVGAVYVVPNGAASGQLDDPTTGITRIEGPQINEISVGFRLNCAGDVNGDGFEDVLIDEGGSSRVWVVFGSAEPESLSLEFLGDRGFAIDRAENIDADVDTATAGVGDLDGDGFDDIAIVSTLANDEGGQVTVVRGRAGIATVHTERDEEVLMRINGDPTQGVMRAESAGDVNGDGVGDILVGAPNARAAAGGAKNTGLAWVISGTSRGDVDLTGEFDGFRIEGSPTTKSRLGMSFAAAGDVDGDGFDDVLIGAPGFASEGGAALVRGSNSGDTVYTDPAAASGHALWSGTGDDLTDRGWWFRDSSSGTANNFAFGVGASAPVTGTDANAGAPGSIVLGEFIKHRTFAMPTTVLGEQPVIDVSALAESDRMIYTLDKSYLGRAIGIIQAFDGEACTQIALGGRGEDLKGDVRLYSVPWSATADCAPSETAEPGVPTEPGEPTGPTDPGDPTTPTDGAHGGNGGGPATPDSDASGQDTGHGSLAHTGVVIGGWIAAATVLAAAGLLIVTRSRRNAR